MIVIILYSFHIFYVFMVWWLSLESERRIGRGKYAFLHHPSYYYTACYRNYFANQLWEKVFSRSYSIGFFFSLIHFISRCTFRRCKGWIVFHLDAFYRFLHYRRNCLFTRWKIIISKIEALLKTEGSNFANIKCTYALTIMNMMKKST